MPHHANTCNGRGDSYAASDHQQLPGTSCSLIVPAMCSLPDDSSTMVYLITQCCVQMRGLTPRVFESLFQRIAELDKEAV